MIISTKQPLNTVFEYWAEKAKTSCTERAMTYKAPLKLLERWARFSKSVPRILGALMARIEDPAAHALLAKNIYSECGDGQQNRSHSALFRNLLPQDSEPSAKDQKETREKIERVLQSISHMTESQAAGFLIGLEAPAYEILDSLKIAFETHTPGLLVSETPYFTTDEEVERDHQADGHLIQNFVLCSGGSTIGIVEGIQSAVAFWDSWWST